MVTTQPTKLPAVTNGFSRMRLNVIGRKVNKKPIITWV
jgi:hypothetical protein